MNVNPQEIVANVMKRGRWLLASTALFSLVSLAYAVLKQDVYDARQPLIVRDEGFGSITRFGEFSSVDAMQTAQETIMEVASHPAVLKAALLDVGLPKGKKLKKDWPSPKTVGEFGEQVAVSAPGGAQFGRTEMIYLTVKAESPGRAAALSAAVCEHLIYRMKELRKEKYASIINELDSTTDLAREELAAVTDELQKFETEMGSNLAELRMSMDSAQGQSHLRESLTAVTNDLRSVRAARIRASNEIQQLQEAEADPALLISMPNQALDAQPTLKKLKESLVEAQVTTARLAGEMSPSHPKLRSAMESEQRLKRQLVDELRLAIKAREVVLSTSEQRLAAFEAQRVQIESELAELSGRRTQYANLLAELDQRNAFLEQAESDLASARANLLSSAQVSLIQKVDAPIPSIDPLGPGRTLIVLGGILGGVMTGLALIYILGGDESQKRRITDQIKYGRRASDAPRTADGRFIDRRTGSAGRRESDAARPQTATTRPDSSARKQTVSSQTPPAARTKQTNTGSRPVIPRLENPPESGTHLNN